MGLFTSFFGPPTRAQFAKRFMRMQKQVGDDRTPSFDEAEFRILFTLNGKGAGVANLGNLYAEYCLIGWRQRPAWLRQTCLGLAHAIEIPAEFADSRPDLMPMLKTRSFIDTLRRESLTDKTEDLGIPFLPISEHLVLCLAYDLPHSMRFVPQDQLEDWGVSVHDALEAACTNLAEREYQLASIGDKVFGFCTGDAYDASRILHLGVIKDLPLSGPPVALAMTRDSLLIAGADDEEGLRIMLDLAEKAVDEPRPLCSIPVRLVDDAWETWSPAADHPHFKRFHALALNYLGSEYADQKAYLEKQHELDGTDVFVANFSNMTHEDGRECSFAVWSKGVLTWLPRTDRIAFYDPDTHASEMVLWERAVETMGAFMTPLDMYPPRWELRGFPTPQQMQRMVDESC